MLHQELTHKIIACCIEVHKIIGCGFQEIIYKRALQYEFYLQNVTSQMEFEMAVIYKEVNVGTRRADFLIDKIIILEIKAVSSLENIHLVQAMNYLEIHKLPIGLLINFGAKNLEFKRVHNNKLIP